MKLTFLGTGTSQGIPVIACDCPVCTSSDPRDNRLRTSAMLEVHDQVIVIEFKVGSDTYDHAAKNQVVDYLGMLDVFGRVKIDILKTAWRVVLSSQ